MPAVTVVGGGFAGVEAAWALAVAGHDVRLYEMRPAQPTPAHTTAYLAELVCSNSFKSKLASSPAGRLKAEMDALGSVVLATAREHEVPAGEALGVDREAFGMAMTRRIEEHPRIELVREAFTPAMAEATSPRKRLARLTIPIGTPSLTTGTRLMRRCSRILAISPSSVSGGTETTPRVITSRAESP